MLQTHSAYVSEPSGGPNIMESSCSSYWIWLFSHCKELMAITVYPALFAVLAFHRTAGLYKSITPEHEANYFRGSHAIFHIERQGMLATRRAQVLWILAAVVVCFLQAYISKVLLDQCSIRMSEINLQITSDEMENPQLGKMYG